VAIPAVNMKLYRGITVLYNDSLAIYGVVSHNGYNCGNAVEYLQLLNSKD